MARYAICDGANIVENVCEWDGTTTWSPPAGRVARLVGTAVLNIGDTFDGTTVTKAAPSPLVARDDNRQALLARGGTALAANATFLALGTPTNPQTLAQVQSLTRQVNALLRLVSNQLDTTTGT